MNKIFVSYRRTDNTAMSDRIYYDRLIASFGRQNVFKDVDSIPPGEDFRSYIHESLEQCAVMLVVIGRGWLTAHDNFGRRRLDQEEDWVRIEIETALTSQLLVIPLLVDNASMPPREALPKAIADLCYRSAVPVRNNPDFLNDYARLETAIQTRLAAFGKPKSGEIESNLQMISKRVSLMEDACQHLMHVVPVTLI